MTTPHAGVFRVQCSCSTPRQAIPAPAGGSVIVCVVCDRGVKDGQIQGPPRLNLASDVPPYRSMWNVTKDQV